MPSTGSTIHTRSACTRDTSSTASSDNTASSGPVPLQPIENQDVGPLVARVAEVVRVVEADFLADGEQKFSGVGGHVCGQLGIGQAHRLSRSRAMRSQRLVQPCPQRRHGRGAGLSATTSPRSTIISVGTA